MLIMTVQETASSGSAFHIHGAEMLKVRVPTVDSLVLVERSARRPV